MIRYGINPDDFNRKELGNLIEYMSHIYMLYFHSHFRNRSRLRGKLLFLFQEIGNIQTHAEAFDLQLYKELSGNDKPTKDNSDPLRIMFSNYIIEFTFRAMVLFIKLGFELELYNSHEYPVVFWYLDFLFGRWGIIKTSNMEFLYKKKLNDALKANASRQRGKKAKKPKNIKKSIPPPTPSYEHILIEAQQSLCRALARVSYILFFHFYHFIYSFFVFCFFCLISLLLDYKLNYLTVKVLEDLILNLEVIIFAFL